MKPLKAYGLRRMSDEISTLGQTRYLKAVTNGRSAAAVTSETFTNTGNGLRPFSPTNLRATRDGSANITFTINRRPRLFMRYGGTGGSYVPPADTGERYELDVYATSGYATVRLYEVDLRQPVAWLFGHEGQGVADDLLSAARHQVVIPHLGQVESLNVAACAAVCFFEQVRQNHS